MMNQKQRDYFVDRVKDITNNDINNKKTLCAESINRLAEDNFDQFLNSMNLADSIAKLKQLEDEYTILYSRVKNVTEHISSLYPDVKRGNRYFHRPDYYDTVHDFLKRCCYNIATNEYYKTEEGQELKKLEDTQRKAIDTIMMDGSKVTDLTLKLNSILAESGLQLLTSPAIGG